MNRSILTVLGTLLVAGVAGAQDLGITAPPQERPIALVNARIHPVSGPPIEHGYVVFDAGKIVAIGEGDWAPNDRTEAHDLAGRRIYPGLVAARTNLGLTEIGAVRATRDFDEAGTVTPEVRAVVAVNPDSTLIPVARTNGILTAGTFPSDGAIPGRAGVIRMDGWTWEDMALLPDAGLVVEWPGRPVRRWWMEKTVAELREEAKQNLLRLTETFLMARAYLDARAAGEKVPIDIRFEAMRSVFPDAGAAQRPVFFQANDYEQITGALAFAKRHGLRPVITGGRDALLCADLLEERDAAVILDGTYRLPRRDDSPYDEHFRLPGELEAAGVRWCLASGQGAANERNLPYAAAVAVAHGLPEEAAIRAITLSPARILGVADLVGSLEVGKQATLIVTNGSPLLATTKVEAAFIDGRIVDLGNKQTALDKKYREKYRQLGIIPGRKE